MARPAHQRRRPNVAPESHLSISRNQNYVVRLPPCLGVHRSRPPRGWRAQRVHLCGETDRVVDRSEAGRGIEGGGADKGGSATELFE